MADGLEGFSPELQRLLRRAGVSFGPGAGQRAPSASWGRGLAPSAQEAAAAPWYQLQRQTGVTPEGWLTDRGNRAVELAETSVKPLDPGVQKLLDQVAKARQIEQDRGGKDTRPRTNFLLKGLDYLGRPGAAITGAATELVRADNSDASQETVSDRFKLLGNAARGAKRGFTAEERYYGSKLLDEGGVLDGHRKLRAVAGFGWDVGADPLTYLTFGTAKAAAAPSAAAVRATEDAAAKAATAGARQPAADLARVMSQPRSRVPMTPRQQAERLQQATGAIDRAAADVGLRARQAAVAGGMAPSAARAVAVTAAQDTTRELTELAAANLTQQISRSLTVKAGGMRLASVPIPAAAAKVAAAAGRAPLISAAVTAFNKTFTTGTRFDRALTATKARSAGLAERRVETVRTELVTAFRGTAKDQRVAVMRALATGGRGLGHGIATTADGRDVADVVGETLDHVGRYVDWAGTGATPVNINDLNAYLPKAYKFDKTALSKAAGATPTDRMADLIRRNAAHLETADPAQYLYALNIATEKAVARDQLARAAAVFGVPASGAKVWSQAGQELAKHGYVPIRAGGRGAQVSAAYRRNFDGLLFSPEAQRGIERLLAVADDVATRGEVLRLYDRSLSSLKKALTLPNPSFHLRNSFGDMFLAYLDDVAGPRGARSYEQAGRTLTAMRTLGKQPSLRQTLDAAVDPTTRAAPDPIAVLAQVTRAGGRAPGPGRRVMRAPKAWPDIGGGDYLNAEQLWAAFQHSGLDRGFIQSDLERAVATRKFRPVAAAADGLADLSQVRDNYFRLAHFIDRLKRSKESTFAEAAEDAAYYVRKYHFDYNDVTPTEQAVFARLFPFYKFQRFAAPLMVQMFFARPGKILNTQRALYGTSDAAGYERDDMGLPTADQVLPEYFRDAAMVPLFSSARGNTVFANPGLPGTAIPAQTLGLAGDTPGGVGKGIAQNVVGSVNPLVQAPFELATGRRVFGGGDVPVGPLPQYVAGKTPITNLAFVGSGKDDRGTRLASFLTGLGLSENTPSRQRGALLDELQRIAKNRKGDGYVPQRGTGRPGRPGGRSDSRGG